jgi:hypothetical protein
MKTFKFGLPAILAIAIFCASTHSFATVLSSWTFETNTPADLSNSAVGPPVLNEGGIFAGTLLGSHASAGSDWSTPAGNGSANSYSANEWAVGGFTQITSGSLGYNTLKITFDATSSNTGPRDWKLQTSPDGVLWTDSGFTYSVLANAAPNPLWNSTTSSPLYTITTSLPATLDNQAAFGVRLVVNSTVSANGGSLALSGTSRIDNVIIEGELIPEPTSIALMIASLGVTVLRRK